MLTKISLCKTPSPRRTATITIKIFVVLPLNLDFTSQPPISLYKNPARQARISVKYGAPRATGTILNNIATKETSKPDNKISADFFWWASDSYAPKKPR